MHQQKEDTNYGPNLISGKTNPDNKCMFKAVSIMGVDLIDMLKKIGWVALVITIHEMSNLYTHWTLSK